MATEMPKLSKERRRRRSARPAGTRSSRAHEHIRRSRSPSSCPRRPPPQWTRRWPRKYRSSRRRRPSAAVNSACWDQVLPDRTNTYTARAVRVIAIPTTTVDPEMATDQPKALSAAASGAASSACWDQVLPCRTNTYTAPLSCLPKGAHHHCGPRDGHRVAEAVTHNGVGSGQLGLLGPGPPCRRTHTPPPCTSSCRKHPPPQWIRRGPARHRSSRLRRCRRR